MGCTGHSGTPIAAGRRSHTSRSCSGRSWCRCRCSAGSCRSRSRSAQCRLGPSFPARVIVSPVSASLQILFSPCPRAPRTSDDRLGQRRGGEIRGGGTTRRLLLTCCLSDAAGPHPTAGLRAKAILPRRAVIWLWHQHGKPNVNVQIPLQHLENPSQPPTSSLFRGRKPHTPPLQVRAAHTFGEFGHCSGIRHCTHVPLLQKPWPPPGNWQGFPVG
jgi:hypothetical protein